MRISTLLRREPFGAILEETLSGFLESWLGQPHQVCWYAGRPDLAAIHRRGEQPWLCNVYLNAIFSPHAESWVLEPVRREFSRSVSRWRRPVQRAYVALAGSHRGARWLAQAGLGISPGLPNPGQLLIVAGNQKIRLLDRSRDVVYGVRKKGSPPGFMQREIEARRRAEILGLPVPSLEAVAADGTWFRERYVLGTPMNRLANGVDAQQALSRIIHALQHLLESTIQETRLHEYARHLAAQVQTLVTSSHLLEEKQKHSLQRMINHLVMQILQPTEDFTILTAQTHGDFQPANILVDGSNVWLIDWEYATRRQAGYDALTFGLHSRFPPGLASRMTREIDGVATSAITQYGPWLGLDWEDGASRRVHLGLFLLEELAIHLEENASPRCTNVGEGLTLILREIGIWLEGVGDG